MLDASVPPADRPLGNGSNGERPPSPSFKDKLVGSASPSRKARNEFLIDEEVQSEIKTIFIDGDRLEVVFNEDLEEDICRSRWFSLVLKVYERLVGYFYLTKQARHSLASNGRMGIVGCWVQILCSQVS
ncbi:hypothetical protein LINGRAHAP2_LOCUS4050 [Linum grandiflorum]